MHSDTCINSNIKDLSEIERTVKNDFNSDYSEIKLLADLCKGVSMITQNCRSLIQNGDKFNELIEQTRPAIIAVQESWATSPQHADYDSFSLLRKNKRGGGVAIMTTLELQGKQIFAYADANIEIIGTNTKIGIVSSVYLPPKSKQENAMEKITELIDEHKKNKDFYLMGDININMLGTEKNVDLISLFCLNNEMYPTITKPTRITKSSATLIDNIFTNTEKQTKSGILTTDISDHLTPFLIIKSTELKKETEKVSFRKCNKENLDHLNLLLKTQDWTEMITASTQQEKYDIFETTFQSHFNLTCPRVSKLPNKRQDKQQPWMTQGLLISRLKKEKLHLKSITKPSTPNMKAYKTYAKIYYRICKIAKSDHRTETFQKNLSNMRQLWQETNTIMNRKKGGLKFPDYFNDNGNKIYDSAAIAEKFNTYFIKVGESLAEKFETNENYKTYMPPQDSKFKFHRVGSVNIEIIIKSMKNKRSCGFDEVSNYLIKQISENISLPMSHLINHSMMNGEIPAQLKIANVVPLFKAGEATSFSNYRPIYLLSIFSKLYEKVVYQQLYSFSEEHIFSSHQFGFRAQSQTTHCVLNFLNNIQENQAKYHLAVFLDLKKAFDTVNHEILLNKLSHYGINENEIKWFRNYLTNRQQKVSYKNIISKAKKVKCGVPQGSMLGPLLFLIFISDMPRCTSLHSNLFADDTTYQHSNNNLEMLFSETNSELIKTAAWFNTNQLTLHPDKTKYILFGHNKPTKFTLTLDNNVLERITESGKTKCFKFLGIQIDEKLSWKHHIEYVNKKILRISYRLMQIRKQISIEQKILIYKGLIKPHIDYGLTIWGNGKLIHKLVKTNKKIIRISCNKNKYAHVEPLLKEHHILQIPDQYHWRIITDLHKQKCGFGPLILQSFFSWNDFNSRYPTQMKYPQNTNTLETKLPLFNFPKIWNEHFGTELEIPQFLLPPKAFAGMIKNTYINNYYENCELIKCYSCSKQPQTQNQVHTDDTPITIAHPPP
jgi:hypothetical protein